MFDVALAQLVVAFVSDAPAAVGEMARVARGASRSACGASRRSTMFAAAQPSRRGDRRGAPPGAAPLPRLRARSTICSRRTAPGRDGRARRDRRLPGFRGVLAERRPGRRSLAGQWVASLDSEQRAPRPRRAVAAVRQPGGAVRARRPRLAARGDRGVTGPLSGSSDAYDRFMGRYSTQLAVAFADFAGVHAPQTRARRRGGHGRADAELVERLGAENVAAAEPSTDFAATLRAVSRAATFVRPLPKSCRGRTDASTACSRSSSSSS